MTSTAVEVPRFTRVFRGRADQVRQARLEVTRYLSACGCPVTDDVTLAVSEFATNAGAPRGALSYPRCSRDELEGGSWV